ncbi:hypothetical protein AAG906_028341 [Vitis piasezkii]
MLWYKPIQMLETLLRYFELKNQVHQTARVVHDCILPQTAKLMPIFDVLVGLNLELDLIRGQILRKMLPSLGEVHAQVHGEEKRTVMMGPFIQEISPLKVVHDNTHASQFKTMQRGSAYKDNKCWKLHKKPQNEQREKSNKAFQGTTGEETKGATAEEKLNSASMLEKSPFTKEQLGLLYKLFREYKLASSSCAFA